MNTPGPWSCNLGNGSNLTHSPEVWAGGQCVATVGDSFSSCYGADDIANAHLIAAAPELLAALEAVDRADTYIHERGEALAKVRAAIRKANGEA